MVIIHDTGDGLPEYVEIIRICILKDTLSFIAWKLSTWFREHHQAFVLHLFPTRELFLTNLNELADKYSLADYIIGLIQRVAYPFKDILTWKACIKQIIYIKLMSC